MIRKQVKVGLKEGGGPPPGYAWSVWFLSKAEREARGFLEADEYEYVVDHVKALASENDPSKAITVTVRRIGSYFELKIKGGVLRKKNVRVFYSVEEGRTIVILGCLKKESEGSLPPATLRLMETRKRKFLSGEYGKPT